MDMDMDMDMEKKEREKERERERTIQERREVIGKTGLCTIEGGTHMLCNPAKAMADMIFQCLPGCGSLPSTW